MRPRPWSWLGVILLLAVGAGAGFLGAQVWPGPLRPHADAVVPGVSRPSVSITEQREGGHHLRVEPADGSADTLFVLYPGGLVRPHAYVWLGVALAPHGVRTVVPVMPLDLAVLAPGRAASWLEGSDGVDRVILGGHSLGGAMTARFAAADPTTIDGLVLMGAFSAEGDDLSGASLPTLVLAAEHDGLATLAEVRDGMARLPADARLEVIDGAVHAFFGRYGPQRGDGVPTIARGEAEEAIATALRTFFGDVADGGGP